MKCVRAMSCVCVCVCGKAGRFKMRAVFSLLSLVLVLVLSGFHTKCIVGTIALDEYSRVGRRNFEYLLRAGDERWRDGDDDGDNDGYGDGYDDDDDDIPTHAGSAQITDASKLR